MLGSSDILECLDLDEDGPATAECAVEKDEDLDKRADEISMPAKGRAVAMELMTKSPAAAGDAGSVIEVLVESDFDKLYFLGTVPVETLDVWGTEEADKLGKLRVVAVGREAEVLATVTEILSVLTVEFEMIPERIAIVAILAMAFEILATVPVTPDVGFSTPAEVFETLVTVFEIAEEVFSIPAVVFVMTAVVLVVDSADVASTTPAVLWRTQLDDSYGIAPVELVSTGSSRASASLLGY